jgi:hypothetical protein
MNIPNRPRRVFRMDFLHAIGAATKPAKAPASEKVRTPATVGMLPDLSAFKGYVPVILLTMSAIPSLA